MRQLVVNRLDGFRVASHSTSLPRMLLCLKDKNKQRRHEKDSKALTCINCFRGARSVTLWDVTVKTQTSKHKQRHKHSRTMKLTNALNLRSIPIGGKTPTIEIMFEGIFVSHPQGV